MDGTAVAPALRLAARLDGVVLLVRQLRARDRVHDRRTRAALVAERELFLEHDALRVHLRFLEGRGRIDDDVLLAEAGEHEPARDVDRQADDENPKNDFH